MTTHRQDDTLVSRAALRDAIRDDLLVAIKAREVSADPSFDGAPVLTIPALNEALDEVFSVPLPTPSEHHAEVSTTATVVVHATCPECGIPARTIVYLSSQLVADSVSAEIRVKATSKARTHVHGQAELEEISGEQITVDDLLADQAPEDAPTEEVETPEADACPYPGCARAADHRGLHRDAEGNKVSSDEA